MVCLPPSLLLLLAACLLVGYLDVSLFALGHFFGDAGEDFFGYLTMYGLKLAVDLAVCTLTAYALYFIFTISTTVKMKLLVRHCPPKLPRPLAWHCGTL